MQWERFGLLEHEQGSPAGAGEEVWGGSSSRRAVCCITGKVPGRGTEEKSAFGPVWTAHLMEQAPCLGREFLIFIQVFIVFCKKPNLICNFGTITKMRTAIEKLRHFGHFTPSSSAPSFTNWAAFVRWKSLIQMNVSAWEKWCLIKFCVWTLSLSV